MIKLKIERQYGDPEEIEVEEYDATEVEAKLNSNEVYFIRFGDQLFSRIDIRHIKIIES